MGLCRESLLAGIEGFASWWTFEIEFEGSTFRAMARGELQTRSASLKHYFEHSGTAKKLQRRKVRRGSGRPRSWGAVAR